MGKLFCIRFHSSIFSEWIRASVQVWCRGHGQAIMDECRGAPYHVNGPGNERRAFFLVDDEGTCAEEDFFLPRSIRNEDRK
jgi:hypothetical protein